MFIFIFVPFKLLAKLLFRLLNIVNCLELLGRRKMGYKSNKEIKVKNLLMFSHHNTSSYHNFANFMLIMKKGFPVV